MATQKGEKPAEIKKKTAVRPADPSKSGKSAAKATKSAAPAKSAMKKPAGKAAPEKSAPKKPKQLPKTEEIEIMTPSEIEQTLNGNDQIVEKEAQVVPEVVESEPMLRAEPVLEKEEKEAEADTPVDDNAAPSEAELFRLRKVERVAQTKAARAKRRINILIILLCVVILAIASVLVVPMLTKEKADDMESARIMSGDIRMNISATGYPQNQNLTINAAHLKTPEEPDDRKLKNDGTLYTIISVNYLGLRNTKVLDIKNDTVLMTVVEGDIKNVTLGNVPMTGELIELTMGDFFDLEAIKEAASDVGIGLYIEGQAELAKWSYDLLNGSVFGGFLVTEGAVINGRDSKLFTFSNRSMLYISLALGQHDAYNIIKAQNELASNPETADEYVTASVEFAYPYGVVDGKVLQVTAESNGVYGVLISTEISAKIDEDNDLNVISYLPMSPVSVKIRTSSASGLYVPVKAIFTEDGQDYVLVKKGRNNLQKINVSVITSNGVNAIIIPVDSDDKNSLIYEGGNVYYEKTKDLLGLI